MNEPVDTLSLEEAWDAAVDIFGDSFEGVRRSAFRGDPKMKWVTTVVNPRGLFNVYGATETAALRKLVLMARCTHPDPGGPEHAGEVTQTGCIICGADPDEVTGL
jgi:hypothetical protein